MNLYFKRVSNFFLVYEKLLAIISIILFFSFFITNFIKQAGFHVLCAKVIYTQGFAACSNQIEETASEWMHVFAVGALALPFFIILCDPKIRKRFLKIMAGFIPLTIVGVLYGANAKFCIMWSCSSLLPAVLGLGLYIFLAIVLACGWSTLIKHSLIALIVLAPSVLAFANYATSVADTYKESPGILMNARERDDQAFIRLDCNNIVSSPDLKEECVAMVQRNKAVDAVDLQMCNVIKLESQLNICRSLIRERIENLPHPDAQSTAYTIGNDTFSLKEKDCSDCGWIVKSEGYYDFNHDGNEDTAVLLFNTKKGLYLSIVFNGYDVSTTSLKIADNIFLGTNVNVLGNGIIVVQIAKGNTLLSQYFKYTKGKLVGT